eukprot:scaffold12435_cov69-Phaeocystis_antarctica.AAC.3
MTRLRGCSTGPLLVASTGLVCDFEQLTQEGLAPALVAILQLALRLGGPARQTQLFRRRIVNDNEGPLDPRGGLDIVVAVRGREGVRGGTCDDFQRQRCRGVVAAAEWAGKGGSIPCRELLAGVSALGMLILHCLA